MAVLSFTALEVDVIVLSATTGDGVSVWVEGASAEFLDLIHWKELLPFFLINELDVLDFVGSTEAIEEVKDWGLGVNRD